MTEHSLDLVRETEPKKPLRPANRHPLAELDPERVAKHLVIFQPNNVVIKELVAKANIAIPGLADVKTVQSVVEYNPDCLWAIARRKSFVSANPVAEGFVAMLPLTAEGLKRLAARTFDGANPDLRLICRPGERPAAIYIWATYAPGTLVGGVSLFMQTLTTPEYLDVDLVSRPNTEAGRNFNEALGFKRGGPIHGVSAPHLWAYYRSRHVDTAPLYDSYKKNRGHGDLSVTVARSFDDLMRVVSIRSAVYMAEQECPYDEEFDGNDLSCTHLLGYIGDEPAGCLRVRYFADFAKIERLAVRREFRHTRLSFQLVRAGIELARVKGYRKLYGHAQKRLVNFWSRFGFKPLEGGKELVFSDFDYVEMVADAAAHPEAIAIGGDPYKIIRPEGRWHVPGILETSASRPVSRPSVTSRET